MPSLWKRGGRDVSRYEQTPPPAFPWNVRGGEDVPRFVRGEDGYWFDPSAQPSGKALLSCAGDLMCEPRMGNANRYGDSYFFHPLFRFVRGLLRSSDFSIANLETTVTDITPYAAEYHCVYRWYHCNAPEVYLDALRYAGFDALVTANNHNCDSGVEGLYDTLNAIDRHRFMRTGTFLPNEEERLLLVNVSGIRMAVVSYGNRYNDQDELFFTAEGRDELLNWFSPEKVRRDVAYAREHGAEFVLCYVHWGCDYDEEPNEQQIRVLEQLRESGVDYIVGSHTHCLQAHHTVYTSEGRAVPLMYSMGNFVTNERKELCRHTGILQLQLTRRAQGIAVEERFVPCYVFDTFDTARFCVVPTDAGLNGGYADERFEAAKAYIRRRLGDDLPFLEGRSVMLSELLRAMGYAMPSDAVERAVTRLSVGSSALCYGAVYFASAPLERADCRRALTAELSLAVATEPIPGVPTLVLESADAVKEAYRAAEEVVRRFGDSAHVVLVTGGSGKTVTRDLVTRVLRRCGGVLSPRDSLHTVTSPWQELHPYHEYAVTELREDHPLREEAVALYRPNTVIVTAAPCDLRGVAAGVASGGTLLYNGADAELCAMAADIHRADITLREYTDTLPCEGLPFDYLIPCTAAARAMGEVVGLSAETVAECIRDYVPTPYTVADCEADGVRLLLQLNTKTEAEALSVLRAVKGEGRRLVVLAAPLRDAYGEAMAEALAALSPAAVFTVGNIGVANATVCNELSELEQALLAVLQEGDTLVMAGARCQVLFEALRRVFGLHDHILFGAS